MLANVCFPVHREKKDCEAKKTWTEDGCRKCSCMPDGKEVECKTCTGDQRCHKEECWHVAQLMESGLLEDENADIVGRPS